MEQGDTAVKQVYLGADDWAVEELAAPVDAPKVPRKDVVSPAWPPVPAPLLSTSPDAYLFHSANTDGGGSVGSCRASPSP